MKSKLLAKRYWRDKTTPMGQVDELAKFANDLINLSLGDPDLCTDESIINGAFADALAGHTKYTDFRGDPQLRQAIAQFYQQEYNMRLNDDEIFVTAGGCIAMYLALEALLDDGDEVIMQAPYFTPYAQQIQLARGIPVELPTYEEDGFQINFDRLQALTNERTRAIIINTPSNPTGSVMSPRTMERLCEYAKQNDVVVISDDIYTAFSFQEPFAPIAKYDGMRERTITINSFSKNYTMTGWRVGNIIAPPILVKTIQQINENLSFTVPSVSQRAAIYAIRYRKNFQPALVEEYRKRTYYAAGRINQIKNMSVIDPPMGTFYLFANIKPTGLTSAQVCDVMLKEAHVLAIPGNAFGQCGEGYVRFCCTVDIPTLKTAFDRLEKTSIFQKS